uniref:Apple domain-containing protein n=1 Tax=Zooxanthella nutricula TaxID=1333877 RepID=A0A7S2QLS5_9DINO
MFGQVITMLPSASSCAARCAATHGCEYYSFWAIGPSGSCHVHDSAAVPQTGQSGSVAGPGTCAPQPTVDGPPMAGVVPAPAPAAQVEEVGAGTQQSEATDCFTHQSTLIPPDMLGSVPAAAANGAACLKRCRDSKGCTQILFELGPNGGLCHLQSDAATRIDVALSTSITGRTDCRDSFARADIVTKFSSAGPRSAFAGLSAPVGTAGVAAVGALAALATGSLACTMRRGALASLVGRRFPHATLRRSDLELYSQLESAGDAMARQGA